MAVLGFQPQYRLTGQPTWINAGAELPPTTTSYTFSGLVPGGSYDMRILEISTTGSAASNIVTNSTVAGESLQGTTITSAGPIINASTTPGTAAPTNGPFNTFSISGGQVIRNGVTDTANPATGVTELYYSNHTTFEVGTNGNSFGTPGWWQDGGTLDSWAACSNPTNPTTFDDEFTTATWLTHATWQTGDNWSFCATTTPSGRGGPNFGEPGNQWWVNPNNTSTAISGLYTIVSGGLQLGLLTTPPLDAAYINGQAGSTLSYVGCLLNDQNANLQFQGYWEIAVSVANVNGFAFQFDIEDYPSNPSGDWTSEIDLNIYTDGSGVQHVTFLITGTSTNITAYTTSSPTFNASLEHIYGIEWTSANLTFFIDGNQVAQVATPTDGSFAFPMFGYLLTAANYGVNGNSTGVNPAAGSLPCYATVRYLRVYSQKPGTGAGETLSVFNIASQNVGVAFSASGSIAGVSSAPTLQYMDPGGAWLALPAGFSVTTTNFSFTHPAIASASSAFSISVRDANNTSVVATSNSFAVTASTPGVPGAPTFTSPSQSTNSITLAITPPTTGGALNDGHYQTQYWIGSASPTTGPQVPYITPGNGSFTDSSGAVWTISPAGVIARTGTADTSTSNVTQTLLLPGTPQVAYQLNTAGNWYWQNIPASIGGWSGPTTTSPLTSPGVVIPSLVGAQAYNVDVFVTNSNGAGPAGGVQSLATTLSGGTGQFSVSGPNTILTPQGVTFKGMGMNIYDVDAFDGGAISASNDYPHQKFPPANFLRYTCFDYAGIDAPSSQLDAIVNKWTNNGNGPSVIEFECHLSGSGSLLEGTTLTAWCGWYQSLAARYKNNPYVWFASQNEPWVDGNTVSSATRPDGAVISNVSTTTAMIWGIYNAVRAGGNIAPFIVMSRAVADPTGITQTFDSDTLTGMSSHVWDLHIYAATSGNSTSLSTALASIPPYISALQAFPGGNVPVLCLECGNSTSGSTSDGEAGGIIMQAVQTLVNNGSLACLAEWEWFESENPGDVDQLVTGGPVGTWSTASLTLTGQGQGLLNWMTTGTPSALF